MPDPAPRAISRHAEDGACLAFRVEAERVEDAQYHPFAVDQRQRRVVLVADRDRQSLPSPKVLC